MESPSLVLAISKLAVAGEQAGFTLEQMIDLLDDGLSVQTLLELIAWRLHGAPPAREFSLRSHWVM
jgi:hypothetical protein